LPLLLSLPAELLTLKFSYEKANIISSIHDFVLVATDSFGTRNKDS
jgi:hypothetical protein